MADTKITALTALTAADPASDVLPIVDISDTTMAASGTTKKISINNILGASGTATLASATITGDLTVATDRLKVVTGSTAVQIGSTTQTQFGTTAWPSDLIAKANSRVLVGNLGTVLLWNESAAAIGNASNLFIGAKSGAGATTFGGSYISAGTENASDRAGFFALSTFQSNGIDRERYRIDSTGVHTWQYVGGVAGTAMTLNSTGLGVGRTPSAWNALYKGLVVGGTSGNTIVIAGNDASIGTGYYLSGAGIYNRDNGSATVSSINMYNRAFVFRTAASGAVDSAITWTDAMTLDASGNLFIGKTATGLSTAGIQSSPSGWIQATVSGDASLFTNRLGSDGKTVQLYRETLEVGNISVTTTGATFNSTSDYRLKESVSPLSGGLARVNALKPSVYKWKSNGSDGEGFLAHELAEIVPAAVNGEKDAMNDDGTIKAQSIDMSRIVPILVAAIQELTARVEALEA
jgi:hypothetical protein